MPSTWLSVNHRVLSLGLNSMPDGVADAGSKDLLVLAVLIHADDAADARALVEVQLFFRRHVEGLAECDVELVVRPDAADAGRVVVALLGRPE